MKKIYFLIFFLTTLFLLYCIIVWMPREYSFSYDLEEYNIKETYNKKQEYYKYIINYKEKTFPLIVEEKYSSKRKHITKIDKYSSEDYLCLTIYTKEAQIPVCYYADELIDFRIASDDIKEKFEEYIIETSEDIKETYENIKIYNYFDQTYFIWNYKGYFNINKEENKTINILNTDDYDNSLAVKVGKYLVTPNYESNYYFNEYLVINTKSMELSSFPLNKDISYSSYNLGVQKDDLYLVDKKNKIEYKINFKKEKVKLVGSESKEGTIYSNGWESISLNKLINKEYSFNYEKTYNFQVEDNKLYYIVDNYRILISNKDITDIVYVEKDNVYYIVNNTLYVYNLRQGEVKLLENKEWNFNHMNKIFIFD